MPAMKWRDRVAIERREPAGTMTCRPVGLLGVLTGRQVYAWAVRDAGLSAKHSTLAQTINRQEAGGTLYTTVIFYRPTPHLTLIRSVELKVQVCCCR